jgi:hypothetical protein
MPMRIENNYKFKHNLTTTGGIRTKLRRIFSLIKRYAMKTYGGMEVYLQAFLTSALDGGEWSASSPGSFTRGTHWIRVWVGPRAVLDMVTRRKHPLFDPARNRTPVVQPVAQALYWLSYPAYIRTRYLPKYETRRR